MKKLIITDAIRKNEVDSVKEVFDLEVLKAAAGKCIQGLGKTIKSSAKITESSLKKLNLTSSGGAGRVLFLLKTSSGSAVLVMLRMKNDKSIGSNMSVQNAKFKKALARNLDLIFEDIRTGNYQEYGF